jgi:hypothetical protein
MSYDHQDLHRESNLSFALIKEIHLEGEVEESHGKIMILGNPLTDESGKELLIYNKDNIKKRRKNKESYSYFNPFRNDKDFEMLFEMVSDLTEVNSITITSGREDNSPELDNSIKLKDRDNKILLKNDFGGDWNREAMVAFLKYFEIV